MDLVVAISLCPLKYGINGKNSPIHKNLLTLRWRLKQYTLFGISPFMSLFLEQSLLGNPNKCQHLGDTPPRNISLLLDVMPDTRRDFPVEKAVCRSVFLTTWRYIFSAELIFGDFLVG